MHPVLFAKKCLRCVYKIQTFWSEEITIHTLISFLMSHFPSIKTTFDIENYFDHACMSYTEDVALHHVSLISYMLQKRITSFRPRRPHTHTHRVQPVFQKNKILQNFFKNFLIFFQNFSNFKNFVFWRRRPARPSPRGKNSSKTF